MIIIVKQLGLNSYALRSIPEVGGGFVAEEAVSEEDRLLQQDLA